ncbi:MAG: exodeoxyribonuclease large subunit XseA [Bacillota bacterium]|jgi:exodeoxyribonuclease VII large subunit
MEPRSYLTIKEINTAIKAHVEGEITFRHVVLKGEISNFRQYPKALYFSLKDQEAKISAVFFLYGAYPKYLPKDGDEVLVTGAISVYVKDGSYQINAKQIELFGLGDQLLALQKLKEKLLKEGLFDANKKRPLPKYPSQVGIIAGRDSAALKDLTTNLHRRYPLAQLIFFPSLVQGLLAPKDLIRALNIAYQTPLDVLIIARGGGAEEDLSAFNDETLVRKVALSPVPTIAAIGHEINLSLVDLVADKRVSTPTGAAELAVPNKEDMYQDIHTSLERAFQAMQTRIQFLMKQLHAFQERPVLVTPLAMYNLQKENLKNFQTRLQQAIKTLLQNQQAKANQFRASLNALSPYAVIDRGYALTTLANGEVLHSLKEVNIGDLITTQLKDGTFTSEVKKKG